jgi:hypothetical protein
MLGLHELQTAFAQALTGRGDLPSELRNCFMDDAAAERFAVYRNNVGASLTAVLRETFPVLCRLVDERFFSYAAAEFIQGHPPQRPSLFEYGAQFPPFLETFPPCASLAYLGDVARLEWAMHLAALAPERRAIGIAALGAFPAERIAGLRLRLGRYYLESAWPVGRIWIANQDGAAEDDIALAGSGVCLEIGRHDGAVGFRTLDRAAFAFRRALAQGEPLGVALTQGLEADASFDAAVAIGALFHDGAVIAVSNDTLGGSA